MKKLQYILFIHAVLLFSCQEQSAVDSKISSESETKAELRLPATLAETDTIFVANDPQVDYIISGIKPEEDKIYEYWVKGNTLIAAISFPFYEINHRWLQDLDGDGKSEIIRAQGFEDGIDYGIFRLKDGQQETMLYFNPVFRDSKYPSQLFWGYPWNVENLVVDKEYKLRSSVDNEVVRDDDFYMPPNQKQLPYLLFEGKVKDADPFKIENIKPFNNLSLQTIITRASSEVPSKNGIQNSEVETNSNYAGIWKVDCNKSNESKLILEGADGQEGTLEIYYKNNILAKFLVKVESSKLIYVGTTILDRSISPATVDDFSEGQILGYIALKNGNKLNIDWRGFSTDKKDNKPFRNHPFGSNETLLTRCD